MLRQIWPRAAAATIRWGGSHPGALSTNRRRRRDSSLMTTRNEYEYIVIGLGGLGSAAAYWLSRRVGSDVLGLEQYEIGHDKGASEDHSRIIRLTYHTPRY